MVPGLLAWMLGFCTHLNASWASSPCTLGYLWLRVRYWRTCLSSLRAQDIPNSGADATSRLIVRVEGKKVGGIILGVSAQWEDNTRSPHFPTRCLCAHKDGCNFLRTDEAPAPGTRLGGWSGVLLLALFRDALVQWTSCPTVPRGFWGPWCPGAEKAKPCHQPCPWISDI